MNYEAALFHVCILIKNVIQQSCSATFYRLRIMKNATIWQPQRKFTSADELWRQQPVTSLITQARVGGDAQPLATQTERSSGPDLFRAI